VLDRKLKIFFFVGFLILANIPSDLCITSAPIIYVSGDGSGDFNCNATNADLQINEALQFVAENSSYTTVYLKGPFTYVINDTLVIGNSTTLAGDSNSTIKLVSNANWSAYKPIIEEKSSGSHDITIRGFKIDGNREGNTNVESGKYYYDLIHLTRCQNINVFDMYLTNNHGDGFKTDSCSNIKLYDNIIYELGHDALYASYCSDVEACNNTITCRTNSGLRLYNTNNASFHDNTITSEGSGGAGIEIQKYGSPTMDNIEVYNNTIYGTALVGIWIFGSNSYPPLSANVYIHHNQIYDTGTNSKSNIIGGILSDGFNALIENNLIDGSYGAGIVQNNVYPGLTGSGYVVTVRNNIITNTRTSTAGGNGYGIYNLLTGTHSFVLQNNCFFNNTGGDFIGVQASPSDIVADPQYADRIDHNYYLKSEAGHWDGNDWVNDSLSSPCIDAGNPLSNYSNEPEPNGNRINIGPDGNTCYASKSELNLPTPILPTANFSSNITSIYAPLSIQFIDTSQNTTAWNWDFGDSTYSTQKNPMHTYSAAGNYTVTLTVSSENGTDSKTSIINVSEYSVLPVSDFSTNVSSGYAPLSVQFLDLSQNVSGWNWNFGDGAFSTQPNPTHVYSSVGSYTVNLIASNANGTNSKSAIITVSERPLFPVADFSTSVTSGYAPLSVQFTDLSKNAASRSWNFGDGAVSTQTNPAHTYSSAGSYTVTLTVSNNNGTNPKSATITVSERPILPVADFSTNTVSGYAPLSVQFTDLSQYAASRSWNFGDGAVSTQTNPGHTYSSAGSYTVTLTVSNTNGTNPKSAAITVLQRPIFPVADFSTSVTSGYAPLSVQFTDLSQYAVSRSWDFNNDGITDSNVVNPVYTYATPGTYTASLVARNANGTNSKSAAITVLKQIPPKANFSSNVTSGTVPLNVLFTDTSTNAPTSWNWNFGDGTANSTQKNPVHTFSKAGSYSVTLTVRNTAGGNTVRKTSYITAATLKPPIAALSANVTSGTAPLTVLFSDKSTGGTPTSWAWNFGDGASSTTRNPVHVYGKAGKYTVSLTASNTAGSNKAIKSNYISVTVLVPPRAAFSATPISGSTPLKVTFTDKSTGIINAWSWNFGDGASSVEKNPVYTYSKVGKYTVSLTASNSAGSNKLTRSTYITVTALKPPVAVFSASSTSGNAPFKVTFTDKSTGTPTAWSWIFGDGNTSTQQNTDHTYGGAGKYTVSLTASNAAGSNTLTRSGYINVVAPRKTPVGAFSASPTSGKAPLKIQFTDRSTGSPTSWSWNFGDGTSLTTRNPVHTYTKKGKFTVSLTAGNSQGSNTNTMPGFITVS
jgi:PKD repeat protein